MSKIIHYTLFLIVLSNSIAIFWFPLQIYIIKRQPLSDDCQLTFALVKKKVIFLNPVQRENNGKKVYVFSIFLS